MDARNPGTGRPAPEVAKTIRILLADDQPLVRAGLAMLLQAEDGLEVVGEAGNGKAAIELAARLRPDVVLMDVRMPDMDGLEATRELTRDGPVHDPDRTIRVIILTTYHVDQAVYAALRAGATGFVLKDAVPDELVQAIKAVADGGAWLHPPVARRLLADFAAGPDTVVPPPATLEQLTPREREVLVLLSYGLSNLEIAQYLTIGTATVKTHMSRTLMKLGLRDRAQAVAVAYRSGLVQATRTLPPRAGADR